MQQEEAQCSADRPNVDRCNRNGDKRVTFVACADIKKGRDFMSTRQAGAWFSPRRSAGDQLFIEYVDTREPVEERRQELQQRYGFLCTCPKCETEAAAQLQ